MLDNEYVAGLFDTDGSVYLHIAVSKGHTRLTPYVKFSGTDSIYRENGNLQQWIKSNVGPKFYYNIRSKTSSHHSSLHEISFGGSKVYRFWVLMRNHIYTRRHLFNSCLSIVDNINYNYPDTKHPDRLGYAKYLYKVGFQDKRFEPHSQELYCDIDFAKNIARLSGIFDGDGGCGVTSRAKYGETKPSTHVRITNWDIYMLEAIQRAYDGNIYKYSNKEYSHEINFRRYEQMRIVESLLDGGYCHEKEPALIRVYNQLKK